MTVFVSAIIAAGGRGTRLGGKGHKQLRRLGGRTLLARSIEPFDVSEVVGEIIVVLPAELIPLPADCLDQMRTPLRFVAGGGRRQDSVATGFDAVSTTADIVVVHDAARPFCTPELIDRTIAAAVETGAAIAAVPVQDTVKERRIEAGVEVVAATVPRDRLRLAQTPQAFRRNILEQAVTLGRSGVEATDEATLAERAGHPVRLVPGDPRNVKITTEADLQAADEMTRATGPSSIDVRVGVGYDLHRVVDGRRLVLAGVEIPGDRGLLGHSDADVVCHAVTDAILGAAGAGDIGGHFPDDDEQWRDASSLDLLGRAVTIVRHRQFVVDNVDVVVVTDWPKISDHAATMRGNLAAVLGIEPDRVAIKGKTSEGVGPVGRGEAMVVHAVALVRHTGAPEPDTR